LTFSKAGHGVGRFKRSIRQYSAEVGQSSANEGQTHARTYQPFLPVPCVSGISYPNSKEIAYIINTTSGII